MIVQSDSRIAERINPKRGRGLKKSTADSTVGHACKIFCVAEDPDSTQSPVIMTLSQLIENAQALVDAVLERDFPTA